MHPVVRGAAAVGGFGLLTALVPSAPAPSMPHGDSAHVAVPDGSAMPRQPSPASKEAPGPAPSSPSRLHCPAGEVPDWNAATGTASCVPLPPGNGPLRSARAHRLSQGVDESARLPTHGSDQRIPRLPNRPEPYGAYRLPADAIGPVVAASPANALLPTIGDEAPPWGGERSQPTGVRIETEPEAPVKVVTLDEQQGTPQVLLVGELYGVTVATRHDVDTPAGVRAYVVFYGHLDRPGPHVVNGAELESESIVGYAGDGDGAETPHVYLEIRQLRHAAELKPRYLSDLASDANSIPTDPRNVLALR